MTAVVTEDLGDGILLVRMNRPDHLNAMNTALLSGLYDALAAAEKDPAVRVAILTGEGRAFCAGLDLREGVNPPGTDGGPAGLTDGLGGPQRGMQVQQFIADLMIRIHRLKLPVIAAVNGAASGGGLALALASDIRIAARSAKFNVAFVKIGLSGCDVGVSWFLPRILGASLSQEMLLTGRFMLADEAARTGLVSRTVPDDHLLDSAIETARLIAGNSPFGVWMTKEVSTANMGPVSLETAIDLENRTQILTTHTKDQKEAVRAFLEKRAPVFKNQ